MFLSRLTLDARNDQVRGDLSDVQRLHRRLMSAFPSDLGPQARAASALLFRQEAAGDEPVLLVQSSLLPDWTRLPSGWIATPWDGSSGVTVRPLEPLLAQLVEGAELRFRLLVNPTRKVDTRSEGGVSRNGRRVPLRTEEAALAWLARKGDAAGFTLTSSATFPGRPDVLATPLGRSEGRREGGTVTVEGVLFEGRLRVCDAASLRAAVCAGIGPGKSYGFGLLSLMRA